MRAAALLALLALAACMPPAPNASTSAPALSAPPMSAPPVGVPGATMPGAAAVPPAEPVSVMAKAAR